MPVIFAIWGWLISGEAIMYGVNKFFIAKIIAKVQFHLAV